MTLLVQLGDLHIGGELVGDPSADLAAAVSAVAGLRALPDAIVATRDLTEHGAPTEYARVRELLAPLSIAVRVLVGNHDDRDALRESFPTSSGEAARPVSRTGRRRPAAAFGS